MLRAGAAVVRALAIVAAVALWLPVVTGGCASGPKVGSRAPAFDAVDGSGTGVSLSHYEDKVVLLYFWATWCAPCAVSGPAVQDLHVRYRNNSNVAVLGVHYDDRGDAVAYQKKNRLTFPVIPSGGDVVSRFGIKKIPSIVIVGRDGIVLLNQVGFAPGDEREFERIINAHLQANDQPTGGNR